MLLFTCKNRRLNKCFILILILILFICSGHEKIFLYLPVFIGIPLLIFAINTSKIHGRALVYLGSEYEIRFSLNSANCNLIHSINIIETCVKAKSICTRECLNCVS